MERKATLRVMIWHHHVPLKKHHGSVFSGMFWRVQGEDQIEHGSLTCYGKNHTMSIVWQRRSASIIGLRSIIFVRSRRIISSFPRENGTVDSTFYLQKWNCDSNSSTRSGIKSSMDRTER